MRSERRVPTGELEALLGGAEEALRERIASRRQATRGRRMTDPYTQRRLPDDVDEGKGDTPMPTGQWMQMGFHELPDEARDAVEHLLRGLGLKPPDEPPESPPE